MTSAQKVSAEVKGQRAEELARQIRTVAEIAQRATSSTNLDELFNRTTELIVQQFGFYHAAVYLIDRAGKYAVLRAACSPAGRELLESRHQLEVGSTSIIGWVSANNQLRIVSDTTKDPIHMENTLLPQTRSEAGIPISAGGLVLGTLEVQSTQINAFGPDAIVTLQTLASQIAVAAQNVSLTESVQIDIHELERLYRGGPQIVAAQSDEELTQIVDRILHDLPYASAMLLVRNFKLEAVAVNKLEDEQTSQKALGNLGLSLNDVQKYLSGNPVILEENGIPWPVPLRQFKNEFKYQSVALLPIKQSNQLTGLIILGGQKETLTSAIVQPYIVMAELISATLEKIADMKLRQERLREFELITSISQVVSKTSNLNSFYTDLHTQVRNIIGDYPFVVALYQKETASIVVPYIYENGKVDSIEAYPLGAGLISILIRTLQPLLLVEDTEKQAEKLGAKIQGKPAKSWMGAPMIVQGEPRGALIVQDIDHEHAFRNENLPFLMALANQAGSIIYNARLLEESRQRAIQLETAAQIARDVSGSLNLDDLLRKRPISSANDSTSITRLFSSLIFRASLR